MSKPSAASEHPVAAPVPDANSEHPPVIRRAEVVAFSLVSLLVITVLLVLYFAKAFILPVITAFIVGTMLSPAAGFLEKRRIPRTLSSVMIVLAVGAGAVFIIGLISAPLIEWTGRMPELGARLKEKLQILDRPLAMWHQFQNLFGETAPLSTEQFKLPKVDWVQPTVEFLTPTFTEFLLFFVTLILFIVSWKDLRRAMIMNFSDHDWRLRTLRILNAIETRLGEYLLMVTMINFGVGIGTGIICALTNMPNPAGLGALAATLNFFPIIGPIVTFVVLVVVGIISASTFSAGLIAAALFVGLTFVEGHFITPTIIGRRLQLNALAVFLGLAFWTWLWGPMGGFLAAPILIVGLILKEHLMPLNSPQLPQE
ncbi:MAG: AI-2E family transporter [Bradyrhizobiaceae bacterium]|nr:MAG: AI-2E family transporter [Bradyrhizobiaceae bacterium]